MSSVSLLRACIPATAFLAGACGHVEPQRQASIVEAAPDIDPKLASALPWTAAATGIEVDEGAPRHAFETGRSLYRVVELPASPRPLHLQVVSKMHWRGGGYLQPNFLLLDSKREVVRDLGAPLAGVPITKQFPTTFLRGYMRVDESPRDSAYLLVRTTDELLKPGVRHREYGTIPLVAPVAGAVVFSVESSARHWPTGVVTLELIPAPVGRVSEGER